MPQPAVSSPAVDRGSSDPVHEYATSTHHGDLVGEHLTFYRHAEMLEDAGVGRTLVFVADEDECDAVRALGSPAAAPCGGPPGWRTAYALELAGADIVMLPVNSDEVREWMASVARDLLDQGATVRMAALPTATEFLCVADWVTSGATAHQLQRLIARAVPWKAGDPVPLPPAPSKFRLLTMDDLEKMPPMEWLIGEDRAGIFPATAMIALFGAPGAGKSFVAADLACLIACRRPDVATHWFGHAVKRGPVLYVVAEGSRGFRHRIIAWRMRYGLDRIDVDLRFVDEPVNLFGLEDTSHILRAIDTMPVPPSLIAFDTLARCSVGADENSAQDIGEVVDHADRVKRETGASVLFNHHAKKDSDVERGSTALRGAVDTLCLVREDEGDGRVLSCEKQKDADEFDPITFYLAAVGDSCVVSAQPPAGVTTLSAHQRAALKTLADVFPKGATATEWLKSSGVAERTFYRVRAGLVLNGYVSEIEKGNSTRYAILPSGHWAINGHRV